MLNWLYKKFSSTQTPAPQPAAPTPKPPAAPPVDWHGRLHAAQGDDAALLSLAQAADVLAVKLEAVQALASEDALKQAERQFRSHDRKVHQLCKQRLATAVAQREARATAQTLLARTRALMAEAVVPANHVVALDRDWAALPLALLEPLQGAEFAALRANLGVLMHERGEAQRQQQRQWQLWTAEAGRLLQTWPADLMAVAGHGRARDLAPLHASLAALQAARPETGAATPVDQALAQALHLATLVQGRLAWFEAHHPADTAPDNPGDTAAEPVPPGPVSLPGWGSLAAVPDTALTQALNQRHARWVQARQPALAASPRRTPPTPAQPTRLASAAPLDAARLAQFEALVQQVETALAEGHVSESQRHLQALERAIAAEHETVLPESLRARRHALRAEHARLKGWQQWGGERARDELVGQAEALAALSQLSAQPVAEADAGDGGPPQAEAGPAPKLHVQAHAEAIRRLRQRWKALDRAGGPASAAQWQRFDAALQTAHQPVAAQQALVKAARQDNLAARIALLATLDDLALPEPSTAAAGAWREPLRELDRFMQAWRQLGPVEHTVPADAREELQRRLHQSVDRIEQPLAEVRRQAAAEREPLITQAEALATASTRAQALPETLRRVRELQTLWQETARHVPLARSVESALWARFKAATDTVYAQREAAFAEREAEQAAHLAAGEALLARLADLAGDATTPAEMTRALAEVEAGWRQLGHLPRGAGAGLEGRFRAAHDAVRQRLAAASRQHWQTQCDSLAARLDLCVAREDGTAEADAAERWAACDALPLAWEQALARRWAEPVQAGPMSSDGVDALLLQLEVAWDLPSAPEWQEARRMLKLQGLKQALEGRGTAVQQESGNPDQALGQLLRQGQLSTAQRQRMRALTAALPGLLADQTKR